MKSFIITGLMIFFPFVFFSQKGMLSLGVRSTLSSFSHDGFGVGTGGQFRLQFSNQVNTDWFLDYITIDENDLVKSEYVHIGWSVLFYPIKQETPKFQPFILAGHCFDYNRKSVIENPSYYRDRWGSAVQTGLGTHWNITPKFDVTFMSQYMFHFTNDISYVSNGSSVIFMDSHSHNALEGHLLTTMSFSYKIGRLWGR